MATKPTPIGAKIVLRTLNAGEALFKPSERLEHVYFVQTGRISLLQTRGTQLIEIAQIAAPECLGEDAAFGTALSSMLAIAAQETTLLQVPAKILRDQLLASSTATKVLAHAIHERGRAAFTNLRTQRSDRGEIPCPSSETAKLFASFFYAVCAVAGKTGSRVEGETPAASWEEVQKFAREILQENMVRFAAVTQILVRLEIARFETEAGVERIKILAARHLEDFFDFYGSRHFKGDSSNLLKTNTKMTLIIQTFLKITQAPGSGLRVERSGTAHIPYQSTIDAMRRDLPGFEADQLFRLEQKGLFVKRTSTNEGGSLAYLPQDFEQTLQNWRILKEIEKWNEYGFVARPPEAARTSEPHGTSPAMSPLQAVRKQWAETLANWRPSVSEAGASPKIRSGSKKMSEIWCPVCMSVCKPRQQACEICGADLQKKAA
jgi:CRP-like cAMP-binding protein